MAEVHRQIQVQLEDVVRKMPKNNLKFIWLNAVWDHNEEVLHGDFIPFFLGF